MERLAASHIQDIIQDFMNEKVSKVERFSTGLSLFVYDVTTEADARYVIRIATPERKQELEDGIFWQKKLDHLGIPLPKLYRVGQIESFTFAIYERLPGDDLEVIYHTLLPSVKKDIAYCVADIQKKVATLDDSFRRDCLRWPESVGVIFRRSEREILKHRLCNEHYIERVRSQIHRYEDYLSGIKPVAFLYDTNVRNVIVHNGKVSGIVDVDEVSFGDPLLTVGRGKALLLSMRQKTDYIDYWCDYLDLSVLQKEIVELYAILYCLRFMGTLGQTLNGNYSPQTDPQNAELLETVLNGLLAQSN